MSFKNMGYDHPSYTARTGQVFMSVAAGSGTGSTINGGTTKWFAFANMLLWSLNVYTTVVGTSTYSTGLANNLLGATKSVAAQQYSVIRITNTATAGATIALSTSTFGPFTMAGNFVASGTATNQIGAYETYQIAGNGTSTAVSGGVAINAGDQVYVVNGTDATATANLSIDYSLLPLANVVA